MLQSMRLRDKMALWYTALTLLSVVAFAIAVYGITDYVLEDMLQREATLTMQQLTAQIENEDGSLTVENEVPLSSGSMYFITEQNGSELASYGEAITLFDQVPVVEGVFRSIQRDGSGWLLLDSPLVQVDHFTVRVRVAVSSAHNDRVLNTLRTVILIGVPLATLIALLGGLMIAKRTLRPIRQIIHSASIISTGDLTARIPPAPSKDELGELTNTLNQMLASVETVFNREKRFTSDASHELRTPVAVLRAYAESLLAEKSMTDEQQGALQTMLNECLGMQKIIGQLLTITRGQEGRYPICMESIGLYDICAAVAETMADQLAEKQMTIALHIPPTLMIHADQSLFTEVVLNLVENAIKYGNPHGHITIRGAFVDAQVELAIQDNGIGIPDTALPHIFERFYRVDAVRDRSGTGLGLSIVQWIVAAHHGSILVQSEVGKGSTFLIRLPVKPA